jgi:hypothetical protein
VEATYQGEWQKVLERGSDTSRRRVGGGIRMAGYGWLDMSLRNEVENNSRWTNRLHVPDIRWTQDEQGDGQRRSVRANCLATNTEYCDRCTHAATQATNVARIKTEGTKGLLQGQVAG